MSEKVALFIKIFKAELEDLTEDIVVIENKYLDKFEKQDIGNFVYQENEAFLEHESDCIKRVLKRLEAYDVQNFPSIDSLIEKIRFDVLDLVKEFQYPVSVPGFIDRKIKKVKAYTSNWSA